MEKRKRVCIDVDEGEYRYWKSVAESYDYKSISEFIRHAVRYYITDLAFIVLGKNDIKHIVDRFNELINEFEKEDKNVSRNNC